MPQIPGAALFEEREISANEAEGTEKPLAVYRCVACGLQGQIGSGGRGEEKRLEGSVFAAVTSTRCLIYSIKVDRSMPDV
jgi:hypothetical protein